MSEQQVDAAKESFAALLEESMGSENNLVGQVIEGRIISIENDFALIDVGLKSEGRVLLKEFAPPGEKADLNVGDKVEVEALSDVIGANRRGACNRCHGPVHGARRQALR